MFTQDEARAFVREARASFASLIEAEIADLESRVASMMSGPVELPRAGSPMSDVWAQLQHRCGPGVVNFTVRGERLFVRSRRGKSAGALVAGVSTIGGQCDTLDAFLDRWDPGEANVNDAAEELGTVLATVIGLRARRGAILRDGVERAAGIAESEYEAIALTGPFEDAVEELMSLYEEPREVLNEDTSASWSEMSTAEQESVIGLVPDEIVDASTIRGRWDQYSALIRDLQQRRDLEVRDLVSVSSLRVVAGQLGVSHVMVSKIIRRVA